MRRLPCLLVLLPGCITLDDFTSISVTADLPDMDLTCDETLEDNEDNGVRVVADVNNDGVMCRGIAYARVEAVSWADVRQDVPERANVKWASLVPAIDTLTIETDRGPIPAGVSVSLEQLVSTASGKLEGYEADPLGLVANIGSTTIDGSGEYLLRLKHEFTGAEGANLADEVRVEPNSSGPLETMNLSFDKDEALQVITIAELTVPLEALDVDPTSITIKIGEELSYAAEVRVRIIGN